MFVIGELHRNLSEVVTIQIPERQTEKQRGGLETKRVKRQIRKRMIRKERERERERENQKEENEVI